MSKVIIVGAGIAGLSAGIYAKQSGFDVTIYESHNISGGASTSWKRKGYFFEGGIHWMIGSSKKFPHYKIWNEVGALNDDVKVHYRDPFLIVDYKGEIGYIYRDLQKLKKHFLELSPEDKSEIEELCKDINKFTKLRMPVADIKGVKVKKKSSANLLSMIKMMPAFSRMSFYGQYTAREFAQRFKSPIIRALLENTIGPDYSAIAMIINLALLVDGDGGYPEGGSLAMASRMEKYFKSLGGEIKYSSKVSKVYVKNGICNGVIINDQHLSADAVIVTLDTLVAIDKLFDEPINESWTDRMRKSTKPMLNTFISLGIEADLSDLPEAIDLILDEPFSCGGIDFPYIPIYNYANYSGYAPKGCTTITSIIPGDSYDYWKGCKENGTYEAEKKKLVESYIEILTEKYPKTRGKVVVWDVATPLTYERYTGSYKGSWMSIVGKGEKMKDYPCKSESIENLYFASQRLNPPGGLSGASQTGRQAVQYLCKDTGIIFQCKIES